MAITQTIKLDLNNHKADAIIIRVGESYTRKIVFIPGTYEGDTFTPTEFSGREEGPRAMFRMVKPDRTFVMQDLTAVREDPNTGLYSFELVPDEYMSQVAGNGYYDLRINDSDTEEEFLYTVQGRVLIDDDMITYSMIESVAAVNGLVFPDDFLTSADLSNYATKQYVDDAIAAIPSPLAVYSTDEQIVGTWLDGRHVYQKTFILDSAITVQNYEWYVTPVLRGDIDIIIEVCNCLNETYKTCWDYVSASLAINPTYISLQCGRPGDSIVLKAFTLKYVKEVTP